MAATVSRPTPWKTILLLCGKCARKLDGGYGHKRKETLRSVLRAALREAGHGREVRIVETRCLGICPKKAVTAVNASHPGEIFVVPAGMPVEEIMQVLLSPKA